MKNKKKTSRLGLAFVGLGVVLVLSAAALMLYNQGNETRASNAATGTAQTLLAEIEQRKKNTDHTTEPDSITVDGNGYIGVLSIPALGLELPVMDDWSYPNLEISPCRYTGSLSDGDLVIAAHNYKQHFGNISSLEEGDAVLLTDINGKIYEYTIAEICTMEATDIEGMTHSGYYLTLFTCTYGGRARVAVRCIMDVGN